MCFTNSIQVRAKVLNLRRKVFPFEFCYLIILIRNRTLAWWKRSTDRKQNYSKWLEIQLSTSGKKEEGSNLLDVSESCPQLKFYERRRGIYSFRGNQISFLFPMLDVRRRIKFLPRLRNLFRLDPRTNALSIAKLLISLFNVFSIHVVLHLRVEANLHAFHFLIR